MDVWWLPAFIYIEWSIPGYFRDEYKSVEAQQELRLIFCLHGAQFHTASFLNPRNISKIRGGEHKVPGEHKVRPYIEFYGSFLYPFIPLPLSPFYSFTPLSLYS